MRLPSRSWTSATPDTTWASDSSVNGIGRRSCALCRPKVAEQRWSDTQAGSTASASARTSRRYSWFSGSTEPMESDTPWSTTGRSARTASRTARGRPPTFRKFSVMTSNQSARRPCSRRSGKCLVRRPTPWPRKGTIVCRPAEKSTPEPAPPASSGALRLRCQGPGKLLLGDDLAALVRALLFGLGRDPALALAAVLAAAAVAATGARAGALAGVDAGTLHLAAGLVMPRCCLVRGSGGGGKHRTHGRGDECALQIPSSHVRHFLSWLGLRWMAAACTALCVRSRGSERTFRVRRASTLDCKRARGKDTGSGSSCATELFGSTSMGVLSGGYGAVSSSVTSLPVPSDLMDP